MYCDGSLDEGEYTVEALMLSRVQGGSRKTFLVLRVSAILFLFWDPIFASMRVWFALFLVSDPGCSSLLALCQPFPFFPGLARTFSALELRLSLLSAPDSNLFDDSSHIFQHCFIPFSHLSGILIIVKRKSPLTQFLFHNMAGKSPTSYLLLLLFIK